MTLACIPTTPAQQPTTQIHIKLINGLTGKPLKQTRVGLEASPGYRELSAETDDNGIATLQLPADATIYTHNTKQYVACADEPGGLIHNDFKVSQILAAGIVQPVAKPNRCTITTTTPKSGELVIFVRPWRFLEDSPL